MKRRNTRQKQAVLSVIKGDNIHYTAEKVLQLLTDAGEEVSLATVYRNLNLLCEEGMIQKLPEGLYDGNPAPHDHVHCIRCGRMSDVHVPYRKDLDKKAAETGFEIFHHTTTYEGLCPECKIIEEELH